MLNADTNKQIMKFHALAGKRTTFFIRRFTRILRAVGSFRAVGLIIILITVFLTGSHAQDTWTKKADFGGGYRIEATGFSIGSSGYIGTGLDNLVTKKDFWQYDPGTDDWTKKANFNVMGRQSAVGFSIGTKGYFGTGYNNLGSFFQKDFWEYDPAADTWTQKADFGGKGRESATGFSIGGKGYIGIGYDQNFLRDFWEYDPIANSWIQKADYGGSARYSAVGFSIGSRGYIGTGYDTEDFKKDFWEYNPASNTWTKKADFGGSARYLGTGFSIGNKGYIGTGYDGIISPYYKKDFWEYDSNTDTWTQKADFGGNIRGFATSFSIGNKGYIGTGFFYQYGISTYYKDLWEYTPENFICEIPANLSATNITSASATLNWNTAADAIKYKIRYKVAGSDSWINKYTTSISLTISGLLPATKYTWQVKNICTSNPVVSSDWSAKQKFVTPALRMGDELSQPSLFEIYPNPASDHATIQFTLTQPSHVNIKVYDVSGREIETALDENLDQGDPSGTKVSAGTHSLQLNTNHFSKGVYFVKMISDSGIQNQKLIVQ